MDSAAKIELGSQKAAQAGEALEEILVAVRDTVRQVGDIASSSQHMAGGARSMTDSMLSISAVVEESFGGDRADGGSGERRQRFDPVHRRGVRTAERSYRAGVGEHAGDERASGRDGCSGSRAWRIRLTSSKHLVSRFKLSSKATSRPSWWPPIAIQRPGRLRGRRTPLRRVA